MDRWAKARRDVKKGDVAKMPLHPTASQGRVLRLLGPYRGVGVCVVNTQTHVVEMRFSTHRRGVDLPRPDDDRSW